MINKNTTIEIITVSDDNYVQHLGVMIASVLINSKEDESFNFYIMDGGISNKSKHKLNQLKEIKDFNIEYVIGKHNDYRYCPLTSGYVINTYYRFEIPAFLPHLSKVLLLDSDLIVRGSLRGFWEANLEDKLVGAVENPFSLEYPARLRYPEACAYFNAGVMLMDLDKLREFDFQKKCFDYVKKHSERIWHVDQCVINTVLQNNWKRLPYRYNFMSIVPHKNFKSEEYGLRVTPEEEVIDAINDNALIAHFIGSNKPWEYLGKRLYMEDYWYYLKKTPWKNYIPNDFNFKNFIKRIILSEKKLNIIRKLLGKKSYQFILNTEQKSKSKKQAKKSQDKFKHQYNSLDVFKISLSKSIELNEYIYLEDLQDKNEKSWYKWFMTNTIEELIVSSDEYEENILTLAQKFLKYNGKLKVISKSGEEKVVYKKC